MAQQLPTFQANEQIQPAARPTPIQTNFGANEAMNQIGSDISQLGQVVSKGIMFNQMEKAKQEQALQNKINAANFGTTINQIKFQAQNSGKVDPELVSRAIGEKPQNAEQIQNEITFGKYHHSLVQTGKSLSVNRLDAYIGQLQSPMSQQEVANPNSFLVEQSRLNAASDLKKYSSQLSSDPAGAIENTTAVQSAIANVKTDPGFNSLTPEQQQLKILSAKSNASITAQEQLGLNQQQVHALTNVEASSVAGSINAQPLQDHVALLTQFVNNFPTANRAVVLRDLQSGGLKESSQYLLNVPPKDQVQAVLAFQNTPDAYNTLLENQGTNLGAFKQAVSQSSTTTSYLDSLSGGRGDNTPQINSYVNHVTLLSLQLMQSNRALSQSDAIQQASTDLLGGQNGLQFVSAGNNGQTYAIPSEVNGQPIGFFKRLNALDMMKDRIQNSKLVVSRNYLQNIPGIVREGDLNGLIVATMHFSRTKDGTGLEALDQYGSPIINSQTGQPFIMSYSDMANKNSQLSQDIMAFTQKQRTDVIKRARGNVNFHRTLLDNLSKLTEIDKDKGGSLVGNLDDFGRGIKDSGVAIGTETKSELEKAGKDISSFFERPQ